ncbi:FAD-binding protein [Streptomyces sp. NPDC048106]|uniref:FAD-binding protein n=1 Tax=Streptomyces sp. NPDC048106 TaxID=3155750 RepID=UPI00345188A9
MSTRWDRSYDVVSVGSGDGRLGAALAARDAGGDALVLEKRELPGGSTAMSGGAVWIPNTPSCSGTTGGRRGGGPALLRVHGR